MPGIPPHKLTLKIGAIVILLRNLIGITGLLNGTRLIVDGIIHNRLLEVHVPAGENAGQRALIPRIALQTNEGNFPFVLQRRQFPVRLAYSIPINKAQGQTLKMAGLILREPVFAHGQLYVALSRVGNSSNLKVYCGENGSSAICETFTKYSI